MKGRTLPIVAVHAPDGCALLEMGMGWVLAGLRSRQVSVGDRIALRTHRVPASGTAYRKAEVLYDVQIDQRIEPLTLFASATVGLITQRSALVPGHLDVSHRLQGVLLVDIEPVAHRTVPESLGRSRVESSQVARFTGDPKGQVPTAEDPLVLDLVRQGAAAFLQTCPAKAQATRDAQAVIQEVGPQRAVYTAEAILHRVSRLEGWS